MTFWVGLGQIVFGAVGLFTGWIDGQASTTLVFTGFAAIGLRVKTTQPVTLTGSTQ